MAEQTQHPRQAQPHWFVVGAGGFVGAGIANELRTRRLQFSEPHAERVATSARTPEAVIQAADARGDLVARVSAGITPGAFVINAAGLASPDAAEDDALYGANALWPAVLALACARSGAARLVHLSSAAVQGERPVLDETWETSPFSPYSRSKALGEAALRQLAPRLPDGMLTILRATSVQGAGRRTTASLARVAASPLASVAGAGDAPSPVSSLAALAQFAVDVAEARPDRLLVLQPWEGMTVRGVLEAAGGRAPLRLPAPLCRAAVAAGYALSRLAGGRLHGAVRRAEVMWFGQSQAPGWAEEAGALPRPRAAAVLRQAAQARARAR
ncbi:NAD-dependent epimerase/dehydratase family protein [Sinomonas mesophila]|uniref:NAD-dependent epimerase/dehydratase family protein n=1 Tax=Sinomonas mesophila TaxID=1531955 RepID=UPI0009855CA9|nr:NAD-dependent epimerase/dehydratase family protein [Sinomonas mesophila]